MQSSYHSGNICTSYLSYHSWVCDISGCRGCQTFHDTSHKHAFSSYISGKHQGLFDIDLVNLEFAQGHSHLYWFSFHFASDCVVFLSVYFELLHFVPRIAVAHPLTFLPHPLFLVFLVLLHLHMHLGNIKKYRYIAEKQKVINVHVTVGSLRQ